MIDLALIRANYDRYQVAWNDIDDGDTAHLRATCAVIVAAEQVPALLAEIERLTAEVTHLRGMVDAAVVWAAPPGPVSDEIRAKRNAALGLGTEPAVAPAQTAQDGPEAAGGTSGHPCDRIDLPERSDMRCPCGLEAGEHPVWRRRYCRNRSYPEHGAVSPCALCGYVAGGDA